VSFASRVHFGLRIESRIVGFIFAAESFCEQMIGSYFMRVSQRKRSEGPCSKRLTETLFLSLTLLFFTADATSQTVAFKTAEAKAHYENAVRLSERAAWAGAVLELNRARELEPSNPEILIELGIALGELTQWNQAIESLKKATALAPDSARAHYNLGVTLDRANPGKQMGTLEYRKALRLNPKDTGSLINLATNIGDENGEEAKQLLLKAVGLEPGNAKAHFNLGLLLKNEGNSKGAVEALQRAITSDPEPVEPRRHLVNLLIAQERWDEVLAQCEEILKRDPEDWNTRYTLAQTLIRRGKADEGRTELQKSQEIRQSQQKQEEVKKLIDTAVSQLTKGDPENGIKTLNSAIEMNPDSAQAHMYLGVALASKGNTVAGIAALNRALTLDPSSARAHHNLGTLLMQTGQTPAARQEFEKALELDSYFSEAHNNFGLILSGEGQVPKAIDHFRIASELNPNYLEAVFNLGLALRSVQRIDDALQAFRRAAELAPNSPQVQFALGMTLKDKGNLQESKKALDRARMLGEAKNPSTPKQ
jgi:tetratricopeptide (TPR) repeat protein